MENTNPSSPDNNAIPAGPGRMLQQARKDLRLAPEDVAQMLHLSSKQIAALEKDDYNNLPGPTYIRGYLRSYAQLLGLSPEQILESYGRLMTPARPIALPKSAPPPQITSSDRLIKVATLGVAAMVLGLVYLWWRSDQEPPERVSSSPAAIGQAPTEESERVSSDASSASPGDSVISSVLNQPPARAAVESIPQTDLDSSPATNAAAPAAPPPAVKAGLAKDQVTVSGKIANLPPGQSPKQAGSAASAPADRALTRKREAADIPPGVARSRLVLHATQESWADVRDARDNKLLYENVPAGRSIAIEGVAPFSVFLGNADGVRVEFNGQNFDVSRYRRGQVARFTLGETPAVNN
jgi:cytoskeleton protein RodZ